MSKTTKKAEGSVTEQVLRTTGAAVIVVSLLAAVIFVYTEDYMQAVAAVLAATGSVSFFWMSEVLAGLRRLREEQAKTNDFMRAQVMQTHKASQQTTAQQHGGVWEIEG